MQEHEYFEQLSALAAMGDLTGEERARLNEHVNECEPCRAAAAEFSRIVHTELASLFPASTPWRIKLAQIFTKRRSEQRFLDRAKAQGYRFSEAIEKGPGMARLLPAPRAMLAVVPSLLLILAAMAVTGLEFRKGRAYSANAAEAQRQISEETRKEARSNAQIEADARRIAESSPSWRILCPRCGWPPTESPRQNTSVTKLSMRASNCVRHTMGSARTHSRWMRAFGPASNDSRR